ncbi:hypothetical protein QG070_05960 [Kingella kingae]|uniref:hypothetical protein n=2 Tax=Kingella kingae TaxID=504 RepID=UPI00254D8B52|nr:hypothetical protein [Kingella kingae]MDK4528640.1 hypothetical protein [Kingella kingae]MDK4536274.1 hypothetical protein [Kingella kingae]MDK4539685.1 hypothetical protein [Kingella kingae]MDK4543304.1 hypothetical protein [Kingella kingae]MDK4547196.1 hypothetical protein [Kingella kingae]
MTARERESYLLHLLFDTAMQQNSAYQPKDLDEYFVFKAAAALLDGQCRQAGQIWWQIVDNSAFSQSGFQAVVPFGKLMSLLPKSLQHGIPAF